MWEVSTSPEKESDWSLSWMMIKAVKSIILRYIDKHFVFEERKFAIKPSTSSIFFREKIHNVI